MLKRTINSFRPSNWIQRLIHDFLIRRSWWNAGYYWANNYGSVLYLPINSKFIISCYKHNNDGKYHKIKITSNRELIILLIIFQTWSIMYHSWTTFVLLLWALILWMVPNKRASMMKCSPFIVFYATLLLLGQYVYSMDLTDEELPIEVSNIKISEIGFSKANELGRWHLIVKVRIISCK